MNIKFNWGFGIAVVIFLFCAAIIRVVFLSFQEPVYMVSDDYYAEEIAYQSRIEELKNAASLSETSQLKLLNSEGKNYVYLSLPTDVELQTAKVHFFRPSDSGMDFHVELSPNTKSQWQIDGQRLQVGLWKVKISWKDKKEKAFYSEHSLVVPARN